MTYPNQHDADPFAGGESTPSLSFNNAPVGTVKTITVDGPAEMAQSRDYDSGDPLFWDPVRKGGRTTTPNDRPVMAAVVKGVDDDGDMRAVWATKPSALFAAIAAAQTAVAAGYRLKKGDKLAIKLTGEEPSKSGKGMKKLYAAKVTPAPEPQPADAFADDAPPF